MYIIDNYVFNVYNNSCRTLHQIHAHCQHPLVMNPPSSSSTGVKVQSSGKYTYQVTPADLTKEQQAFQPGEGVGSLYILYACV